MVASLVVFTGWVTQQGDCTSGGGYGSVNPLTQIFIIVVTGLYIYILTEMLSCFMVINSYLCNGTHQVCQSNTASSIGEQ